MDSTIRTLRSELNLTLKGTVIAEGVWANPSGCLLDERIMTTNFKRMTLLNLSCCPLLLFVPLLSAFPIYHWSLKAFSMALPQH